MSKEFPLIIEPADLASRLDDPELLIVDVCQPNNWRQLHLPGAQHFDPSEIVRGTPPAPGKLPSLEALEALFSRIGYSPDKHIVVYDDEGGGWAGRFIWILDAIGHSRYSYLNGGLYAWYREAQPLTAEVVSAEPTQVTLQLNPAVTASMEQVLTALDDPDTMIWDARSAEEYAGLKSGSMRAGHIPGAINLDWLDLMDRSDNLRLLPREVLRAKLVALGLTPGHKIITHCQTHHRSGLSYLVAKLLGYEVRAYDGSWAEWGNQMHTPVESMA